jgi:hypothetical protein
VRRAVGLAGRRAAWSLLFAILLLRAFVPAGYMAGTAASGAPALVLCPGVEAPPVHAMAMHGHRHDPATHRESPCPFAALTAPALPPAPSLFTPPPAPPAEASRQAILRAAPAPGPAAPPPPATGPPAFA